MTPSEIAGVESATGVKLPETYRRALQTHDLSGDWEDHPEFVTDPNVLITENKHFTMNPEDLSEIRSPGLVGALKFFLLYGSGKRVLATRRKWYDTWVKGKRFVIGSDLGEEQYFIVLSDPTTAVHCYELETQRSRRVASSAEDWLLEVKRRQAEAESEA